MKKLLFTLVAAFIALATNAATVYFQNTEGWSTVKVHRWGGSNQSDNTDWASRPTVSQKIKATNGIEYFVIDTKSCPSFNVSNEKGDQTSNLTAEEGIVYDGKGNTLGTIKQNGTNYVFGFYQWPDTYVNLCYSNNNNSDNGKKPDNNGIVTFDNLNIGTGTFYVKTYNSKDGDRFYGWNEKFNADGSWTKVYLYGNNVIPSCTINNATANSSYNISYNLLNEEIKLESVSSSHDIFLTGIDGNYESLAQYKFTDTGDHNIYTLKVKLSGSNGGQNFKFYDNGIAYGNNSGNTTLFEALDLTQMNMSGELWIKLPVPITVEFTYYVNYNNTGKPRIEVKRYPDQFYIYGHLKNRWWEAGTYYVMRKTGDYTYEARNVEVNGRWSSYDATRPGVNRTPNESTLNENYIALYDHKISSELGFNENEAKYGSYYWDNNTSKKDNLDITQLPGYVNGMVKVNIEYHKQQDQNNFVIPRGLYNFYYNAETGELTIEKVIEPEKVQYTWFYGDDERDNESAEQVEDMQGPHHSYSFVYGDENPDRIQVGVITDATTGEADPMHEVARQVDYTVYKYIPRNNPDIQNSIVTAGTIAIPNGYTLLPEDSEDYEKVGGTEYLTNHLVQFNNAGEYFVVASIIPHDEQHDLIKNTYADPDPVAIYVSVSPRNLTPSFGSESTRSAAFNEEGANILKGSLALNSEATYGTDFTLTVVPATEGWPSVTAEVAANATQLEDAYRQAFNGSDGNLIGQLIGNGTEADPGIGISKRVDGFYTVIPATDITAEYNETTTEFNGVTYYNYDVSVKVPCSGVYTMSLISANGNNTVEAADASTQINIYPNLYAKFNNATGFNINGYMWTESNGNYTITLPTNENLSSCVGYIPGTYFASALTTNAPSAMQRSEVRHPVTGASIVYRTELMNLTGYPENNLHIDVTVTKNGATNPSPYIFNIKTGTTGGNVSTGVEVIGSEEGEAVYYNLQGVKVENPQHGIYVKVVNGVATKVVL